jgi:hypothetical protein
MSDRRTHPREVSPSHNSIDKIADLLIAKLGHPDGAAS